MDRGPRAGVSLGTALYRAGGKGVRVVPTLPDGAIELARTWLCGRSH